MVWGACRNSVWGLDPDTGLVAAVDIENLIGEGNFWIPKMKLTHLNHMWNLYWIGGGLGHSFIFHCPFPLKFQKCFHMF